MRMSASAVVEPPSADDLPTMREVGGLPGDEADGSSRISAWDPQTVTEAATRIYRGRTVEELIPRIQAELGADAIILGRREGLTGGFAGFFQRSFVEIEAMAGGPRLDVYDEDEAALAHDPPPVQPVVPYSSSAGSSAPLPLPARVRFYEREPLQSHPHGVYVSERLAALARAGPREPAPAPRQGRESHAPEFREYEAADLSTPFAAALEQASSQPWSPSTTSFPRSGDVTQALPPSEAGTDYSRADTGALTPRSATGAHRRPAAPSRPRAQASIQRKLIELGVGEQFAEELIDAAAAHILPLAPRVGLTQAVRSALIQRIPVAPPLPTRAAAITLVGPGGAGKTSCAAALLSAYRKSAVLPASCATLIRGSKRGELQMLLSPHVMKLLPSDNPRAVRALHNARGEGLLVIDTPPLSPGDRSGIRKLAALLDELKPERVVVVLPATLGAVAAAQLLRALRPLGANALAVTHADETDQIGVAVEAACAFDLAPEYTLDRARAGGWRLSRTDPAGLAAKLLQ